MNRSALLVGTTGLVGGRLLNRLIAHPGYERVAVWVRRPRYGETDQTLIREAWNSAPLYFFRWFAALPAFDGLGEGSTCVWFTDLRFLTPGREGMPFRYRVCRERPDAPWRLASS